MILDDFIQEKIYTIEKYISKRGLMLGKEIESFSLCINRDSKDFGKISLTGVNDLDINDYATPNFVDYISAKNTGIEFMKFGVTRRNRNCVIRTVSDIKNITLGKNVTKIDEFSFSGSSIEKINIIGNLDFIGCRAFEDCGELQYIDFTKCKGAIISSESFKSCVKLKYADLSLVKEIGSSAFKDCRIEEVILPEIKCIEAHSFLRCLISGNIVIPDSVNEIQTGAIGIDYEQDRVLILGKNVRKIFSNALCDTRYVYYNRAKDHTVGKLTIVFTGNDIERIDRLAFNKTNVYRIYCNYTIRKKLGHIYSLKNTEIHDISEWSL